MAPARRDDRLDYDPAMSLTRYMLLPAVIALVGIVYGIIAHEPIGTVLLIIFSGAMAVMGWILIPTLDHEGPTAPIDPDFEAPPR